MRKIIILSFVTIDGIMQAPGGPEEDTSGGFRFGGWTVPFFDESLGKVMGEQMSKPFELLLGRKTYDIFASYWPTHEKDWPGINDVTKYVVTHHNMKPEWKNTVVLKDDAVVEIKKIKHINGPDIQVHGSGDLIQTLLKNDLADELWLKIFPITLGSGKRLFDNGTTSAAFSLIDSNVLPSGVIVANFKRAGDVKTGYFS